MTIRPNGHTPTINFRRVRAHSTSPRGHDGRRTQRRARLGADAKGRPSNATCRTRSSLGARLRKSEWGRSRRKWIWRRKSGNAVMEYAELRVATNRSMPSILTFTLYTGEQILFSTDEFFTNRGLDSWGGHSGVARILTVLARDGWRVFYCENCRFLMVSTPAYPTLDNRRIRTGGGTSSGNGPSVRREPTGVYTKPSTRPASPNSGSPPVWIREHHSNDSGYASRVLRDFDRAAVGLRSRLLRGVTALFFGETIGLRPGVLHSAASRASSTV